MFCSVTKTARIHFNEMFVVGIFEISGLCNQSLGNIFLIGSRPHLKGIPCISTKALNVNWRSLKSHLSVSMSTETKLRCNSVV